MKRTISLVLVLALGMAMEVANADFTFGTPTNLGPTVNSSSAEASPCISSDGLELYFQADRPGGSGTWDIWVTTRETINDPWGIPVNLGPTVNSFTWDLEPSITANGELYFTSRRPGGYGNIDGWVTTRASVSEPWGTPVPLGPPLNGPYIDNVEISFDGLTAIISSSRQGGSGGNDLWISTRPTLTDAWSEPVNLGPEVNTAAWEIDMALSADNRFLFFTLSRSGGSEGDDLWLITRATTNDAWSTPLNLGPEVNSSYDDYGPGISFDGSALYFSSDRPGGSGGFDLWQVSIEPLVDLNGDGIVDCADMCIMVDHWGTDNSLCDIGPMPWGDGVVDVKDLIVLAEHLFEGIPPVELEEVNVDEEDDGSQVELEQGQILVVTLESNPTTGYGWEVAEIQESILEQLGDAEFKQSETGEPPLVGAGGWEIFRFKAISAGQMTLKLGYRRPWEEGVEPIDTFSIDVVVN